jgi:hypothetical protein
MHGGLKSKANFSGTKPFGGPDFLLLLDSFFAAGFYFSSLRYKSATIASGKRSSWLLLASEQLSVLQNLRPYSSGIA